MDLINLAEALGILRNCASVLEVEVIHDSFPNGAPNHSNKTYFAVEMMRDPLDGECVRLRQLGWRPEQDGVYWVHYN